MRIRGRDRVFFQTEDGIRVGQVLEFGRVLFRSTAGLASDGAAGLGARGLDSCSGGGDASAELRGSAEGVEDESRRRSNSELLTRRRRARAGCAGGSDPSDGAASGALALGVRGRASAGPSAGAASVVAAGAAAVARSEERRVAD